MRSSEPLTEDRIRANFERALSRVLSQGIIRSDQGFDVEVDEALNALAWNFPNYDEELVRKARQALEFQLDGTHAVRRRRKMGGDQGKRDKTS